MGRRATSSSARACSARAARAATLAVAAKAAPPFRFSRMGPKGTGRQPSRAIRLKLAELMAAGGGETSDIPSGFTYLGQFIDHDLTFDKTNVMLGTHVAPTALLQARSPSLDLDSLYGAGPQDPESAKFYEADGMHLKTGTTEAIDGIAGQARLRPPARRRHDPEGQAQGDHPRPAQRREPRGRPDPLRDDPLPQPRARHAARLGPRRPALRHRPRARHQALPVDDPDGLPAADLPPERGQQRLQPRPQGVRGRRRRRPTSPPCRSSSASPRSGSGTRWCARPTTGTRSSTTARAASTCCSRSRRPAATSAAARTCRATGSPTSAASTTSARPARPT